MMNRRKAIKNLGFGLAGLSAGTTGNFSLSNAPWVDKFNQATNGLPDLKVTNVKAIPVQPGGTELVVVKVETSEPGLYGLGCATFRQRAHAVVTAVDKYLNDFCTGRSANNIEDMWQMVYTSSYWRNGPVLNNALSGLDQALWDIKAKRANMPLYELLGGKCRFAPDTYAREGGDSIEEVVDNVQRALEQGYRHVRMSIGGYNTRHPDYVDAGFGHESDRYMDQKAYLKTVPQLFEAVRNTHGEEVELMIDVHERIEPMSAINLCKELEKYRPFFIEDPFSPQNNDYFPLLRQHTTVPIAMGELFNNPNEWVGPMSKRWFDFIRIHVSQSGGVTPAMKVARLGEWFNVKTAWHGPGDCSPVGHACNAHMSLATWNTGILEMTDGIMDERLQEVFPGAPRIENGYAIINEAPGHGVDINEDLAAKLPIDESYPGYGRIRDYDGTPIRP